MSTNVKNDGLRRLEDVDCGICSDTVPESRHGEEERLTDDGALNNQIRLMRD